MSEAELQRPEGSEVLRQFTALIAARPHATFQALVTALDPGADAGSVFVSDAARGLVVAAGGWWYRAEYRVVAGEHGSHLEHAVVNVAAPRKPGRFTGRRILDSAEDDFARLVRRLRAELE